MTTEPRTVTIRTLDNGDVTLTCPAWCTTRHEDGVHRADIFHESPERALSLPTRRGPVELLLLAFEQRPYAETWPGTAPFVNVGFGGDYYPMRARALQEAADALMDQAAVLRQYAAELTALLGEGDR